MNAIMLAGLAAGLAATPPTGLVHHVEVPHAAGSVGVSYHGDVEVERRQVGMSLAGRPGLSTARCVWKAELRIERRVAEGAGLSRSIDAGEAAGGSRHGDCLTMRHVIADDVARKVPAMQAALVEAARRDRPQLAADLEGAAHGNQRFAR